MKMYEKFVYAIINNRFYKFLVIVITLLALVGSVLMIAPTKIVLAKMLPGKSANTYSVYIDLPTGSSIEQTKKVGECVLNILKKEKEVTDIESFYGEGAPLDYAGLVKGSGFKNSENVAEFVINLTDKHEREERSYEMVHRLRPIVKKSCEKIVNGTVIKMIEQPAGPPTLASIVTEIYGQDLKSIRKLSERVAKILKHTEGLVDIDVMDDDIFTKYNVIPNVDKIQKSGLAVEQVQKILYLAFEGMGVGVKNSDEYPSQIEIFLRLSDKTRRFDTSSLHDVKSKLSSFELMNQRGMMVPLGEVVDIVKSTNESTIMHKNLRRYINVTAETDEVSQVYPLLDARDEMIKELSKDFVIKKESVKNFTHMFDLHLTDKKTGEKFDIVWDGEMKVTLDTFRDLGLAFIAALVLIYVLMVIYYKSYSISSIIMAGSFLSIIGVIVGHWVADIVTKDTFFLTATSLIGFIALMGISSRNSLLLVDFAKALMEEKGIEKKRAIAIATATRAKPIMLTAIAIILGSALLASDPIFGGLGVALIGGTVAAVAVSLIFIPVLMDNTKAI
ncbi:MAG: efflux RND transporter permease subunit [Epsilonproteobacteria bacterium]|nr:efflux RND transporter permease subunit [Campylobacterota bacterium]